MNALATIRPSIFRSTDKDDIYDPDAQLTGGLPRLVQLTAGLFVILVALAMFVPIGGAVIGTGMVGSEGRVKQIAHPVGGTVSQINVKNGQHVRKGDILLKLDDRVSGADAALSSLSVDQLSAQQARLEAELRGLPAVAFPPALASRTDDAARAIMAEEKRVFALRRSERAALSNQLQARGVQSQQQIIGYEAQISSLRRQAQLVASEQRNMRTLYDRKLVTLARFNQGERQLTEITGSIASLHAQIAQARAQGSEVGAQSVQMVETRLADAASQLSAVNAQLNQQRARSVAAVDTHERMIIRASQDGIVDKLVPATIGGVIRPAETLMVIVPDGDKFVVDGAITPADIDQVRIGQLARVRLSALSAASTPELTGKVIYIGVDPVIDEKSGQRFVPVRVALETGSLKHALARAIKPGLPAELFIETGSRSMLSYLTKPLRDQLARSFKDN